MIDRTEEVKYELKNDPKTEVAPMIDTLIGSGETFKTVQEV